MWRRRSTRPRLLGITARVERLDWDRITGRVWQRIDPLAEAGEQWRHTQPNTTVFKGEARFIGDKTLEVNGQRLTAPRVILAAGSRPAIPDIPGLGQVRLPYLRYHHAAAATTAAHGDPRWRVHRC